MLYEDTSASKRLLPPEKQSFSDALNYREQTEAAGLRFVHRRLFAQAKLFHDRTVARDIFLLKIAEQIPSVTDHFQHAAAAVMILWIVLEMLVERVDAIRQNRDLHLGRARVALMRRISRNNFLFFVFQHNHSPHTNISRKPSGGR